MPVADIVQFSRDNQLTHVPSALSMSTYIEILFTNQLVKPYRDRIVIGKPFGSQAYYIIWKKLGYISNIETLSVGVKHDEIDFVDYGEETMGNALGVAAGIAIANPKQMVWCNLTDATLQMGSTLEALQYIGHNQLANIVTTVDYNNMQVTGATDQVLSVHPIINMCSDYNWNIKFIDGHNKRLIKDNWSTTSERPNIYFYKTVKGFGVDYMEKDPVTWHYRPIEQ